MEGFIVLSTKYCTRRDCRFVHKKLRKKGLHFCSKKIAQYGL